MAKASEEASLLRFFQAFLLSCSFSGHGGLAGENELGDVGESDGVAAGDTLARELSDEIAEEEIDLIGGGETVDVGKKFGGEDFGIDNGCAGPKAVSVISTERRVCPSVRVTVILVDQHVATLSAGVLVLALMDRVLFRGHGLAFREIGVTT